MKTTFKFACLGAAALAVSGCSLPNYSTTPEPVQLKAPVAQPVAKKPAVAAAPAPVQAAAEVPEVAKPKNPWAHVPIGNTPNLSDGDEDGGWG